MGLAFASESPEKAMITKAIATCRVTIDTSCRQKSSNRSGASIAHRVLDVLVAQLGLKCPGIVALVGQGEATGEGDAMALCFSEAGGSPVVYNSNFNRRIEYSNAGIV